jgi:hypothetical protein
MMGRELKDLFPMVPLAQNQGLGIAIMSYNGRINFGLVGDYDLLSDLDELAGDLHSSLGDLAEAAGVKLSPPPGRKRRRRSGSNGHKPGARIGSTSTAAATSGDK